MDKIKKNILSHNKYIILINIFYNNCINFFIIIIIVFNRCFRCQKKISKSTELFQCQFCFRKVHGTCLTNQELSLRPVNNVFRCEECHIKLAQLLTYNYNTFGFAQMQNPQRQMYQRNDEINNNINNNLINNKKNKKQNKKYEEINTNMNIQNNNNAFNQYNINNQKVLIDNVPVINSFYYNNNMNISNPMMKGNVINSGQNSMNSIEGGNSNINSINNNSSMKNLKLKKPKPKKYNYIFNKNTLQVLENLSLTNEDKLLYILNTFKNIQIDPLIIKVLEERKSKKRIGLYENMLSEEQNITSGNDINKLNNNNMNQPGTSTTPVEPPRPTPPPKPTFPMEDKILFSDLSKYNISIDILDRPLPMKIVIDYHIMNKLFIIWDFLITFKDIIFIDKIININIDKNILIFYKDLLNEENDFQYYKNIYVSLLLLCVKNIQFTIKTPKDPRLFILRSVLDNLHSTTFNIIYDSPLIILKELIECNIYSNSIEEKNYQILQNILKEVNNMKDRESYERNKTVYEKDEFHEDNIRSMDVNTKIFLLHIIIGLCFETLIVKEKIKNEYDNMATLSYQKKGLEESMFEADKRLKELNRLEDINNLNTEIEKIEKHLEEIKQDEIKNNNINGEELLMRQKEKEETEKQINRMKSIKVEYDTLTEKKKEISKQISDVIEKIYNLKTLRKKYLGIDYQNNEYYYFISGENKIYIKNRKKEEWAYFENKDDIQTLINKLTDKGKNEKKLKIILKFFLSQMKEKEEKEKLNQEINKDNDNNKDSKDEIKSVEAEEKMCIDDDKMKLKNINSANNTNNNSLNNDNNTFNTSNKNIENIDIDISKVKIDLSKKKSESERKKLNNNKISLRSSTKKKSKHLYDNDNIQILDDDSDIEIQDDLEIINNASQQEKESSNTIANNDSEKNNGIVPKKEIITFELSEERLPLNKILINMDKIFSDYLVQFNKQWESENNRIKWKEIITKNATDMNILTTLKMFNHKFKNPYKIIPKEEDTNIKEKINNKFLMSNFSFEEENGNIFDIPETNSVLLLSPKVKIWSKDMDLIDMDFYYNNDLLMSVFSREQLCYAVHFYEMAIFGLVHRREGKRKV